MKTINQNQLADLLKGVNHAMPFNITALTIPPMRKTGNPFQDVRKLSVVNNFLGANYSKSVNRQLGREGKEADFVAQPRKWGTREGVLVEHNGKRYVEVMVRSARKPVYLARIGGLLKVVSVEKLREFMPEKRKVATQGTEKEIVIRDYSLENIVSVSINGEKYKVRNV